MNIIVKDAVKYWPHVAPLVAYPKKPKEFDDLVNRLDELLDFVGDNENHPLRGLIDILSLMVAAYEQEHFKPIRAKGVDVLKYLMETHHLKQSDLTEIGSQGVVSEILNGKRQLNLQQIKKLAKRFHVTPDSFIN